MRSRPAGRPPTRPAPDRGDRHATRFIRRSGRDVLRGRLVWPRDVLPGRPVQRRDVLRGRPVHRRDVLPGRVVQGRDVLPGRPVRVPTRRCGCRSPKPDDRSGPEACAHIKITDFRHDLIASPGTSGPPPRYPRWLNEYLSYEAPARTGSQGASERTIHTTRNHGTRPNRWLSRSMLPLSISGVPPSTVRIGKELMKMRSYTRVSVGLTMVAS